MSQSRRSWLVPAVIGALAVFTVLVLLLMAFVRKPQTAVAGGGEIVFEECFAFRVASVRSASSIGAGERAVRAAGRFWIVELEVTNRWPSGSYDMRGHRPVLVGGTVYDRHTVDARAQEALRECGGLPEPPERLAAGATCTQELVYDVPASADRYDLRIQWGGPLGELLKDIVIGDHRITIVRPHGG